MSKTIKDLKTKDITFDDLKTLKKEYWQLLNKNSFPSPPESGKTIEMIQYFKRRKKENSNQIGPYVNITVFEAANRIASDLVIINGIIQLMEKEPELQKEKINIWLGVGHKNGFGDFNIGDKNGEAFNVASSFYKVKLAKTLTKWEEKELTYVLVNKEIFEELKTEINIKVIQVDGWEKE